MPGSMIERMKGAALLDVPTYEEVEADVNGTGQAAVVVVLASLAQGIGNLSYGGRGIIGGIIAGLVGWAIWAGLTYLIGERIFKGTATWGELLRTLGFAQTPAILYALAIIPGLNWIVRFVAGIWVLVCGIVAIRQALDVTTGKAVLTAIIGWAVLFVLALLVGGWLWRVTP